MTFLKTILAAAAIAGFATSATAQDTGAYGTLGGDYVNVEGFDTITVTGRLGYNFTENFAVEGQAAFGIIDDSFDEVVEGVAVEANAGVNNSFAGFFKAGLPLDGGLEVFARVGYHFTEFGASAEAEGLTVSDSDSTDGIAVGAGGQYFFDNANGVRLEYTLFDGEGGNADVISLSYVRKF